LGNNQDFQPYLRHKMKDTVGNMRNQFLLWKMEDVDQPKTLIFSRPSHDNLEIEVQDDPGDRRTGQKQSLHCSSSSNIGEVLGGCIFQNIMLHAAIHTKGALLKRALLKSI